MSIRAATAQTTYGACGAKVWIFKGEVLAHDPMALISAMNQPARQYGLTKNILRGNELCWRRREQNTEKPIRDVIHGNAKGGTDLNFGSFGLKAQSPGLLPRAR